MVIVNPKMYQWLISLGISEEEIKKQCVIDYSLELKKEKRRILGEVFIENPVWGVCERCGHQGQVKNARIDFFEHTL